MAKTTNEPKAPLSKEQIEAAVAKTKKKAAEREPLKPIQGVISFVPPARGAGATSSTGFSATKRGFVIRPETAEKFGVTVGKELYLHADGSTNKLYFMDKGDSEPFKVRGNVKVRVIVAPNVTDQLQLAGKYVPEAVDGGFAITIR